MSLTETIERIVEDRLEEDDVACARCEADALTVDVWGVADGEPRAAAECDSCGSRLNVRVAEEEIARARAMRDGE